MFGSPFPRSHVRPDAVRVRQPSPARFAGFANRQAVLTNNQGHSISRAATDIARSSSPNWLNRLARCLAAHCGSSVTNPTNALDTVWLSTITAQSVLVLL